MLNQYKIAHYRPDVDGLRAVAVIGVLVFHAFPNWLPGGFVGVDIFFVISGFLITGILLREQDNGSFSFRRFYARRIRRIFPALFCVLSAVLIFGWFCLFGDEYKALGKHVFGGSAFIANIFYWQEAGYWDVSSHLKPLLHLWSLGIEEQFYIFFPLLLWLVFKKKLRLLTFLCILWIASFALNISFYKRDPALDFYAPFTRFWELLCGGGLACMFHRYKLAACSCLIKIDALLSKIFWESRIENDGRSLRNLLSILGLGLILGAGLSAITNKDFPGFRALLPVMGTVFLIAAGPAAWVNRFLLSRPWVVGTGLISYPLYLWHWPLLSYATILDGALTGTWEWRFIRIGCLAVAFILAVLTYKFVENPIRFGKKHRGLKTAVLLTLVAGIGTVGLTVYLKDGFPERFNHMELVQKQFTYPDEFRKFYKKLLPDSPELYGYQLDIGASRTVAILGDSHAVQAFPAIAEHNRKNGINTVHFSIHGWNLRDEKLKHKVFDFFRNDEKITDIFLIYRGIIYLNGKDIDNSNLDSKEYLTRLEAGLYTEFKPVLQKYIDDIIAMGKNAYLLSENPVYPKHLHAKNFVARPFSLQQNKEFPTIPLAEVREHQKPYLEMLTQLKNVTIINGLDPFCPDGICRMFSEDGIPYYLDDNHISYDAGGRRLVDKALAPYLDAIAERP